MDDEPFYDSLFTSLFQDEASSSDFFNITDLSVPVLLQPSTLFQTSLPPLPSLDRHRRDILPSFPIASTIPTLRQPGHTSIYEYHAISTRTTTTTTTTTSTNTTAARPSPTSPQTSTPTLPPLRLQPHQRLPRDVALFADSANNTTLSPREPDSDDFLAALIDGHFSSPSTYPSIYPSTDARVTAGAASSVVAADQASSPRASLAATTAAKLNNFPSRFAASSTTATASPSTTSQNLNTLLASSTHAEVDFSQQTQPLTVNTSSNPGAEEAAADQETNDDASMAPETRRKRTAAASTTPVAKRRRTSAASTPASKRRGTTASSRQPKEDDFDFQETKAEPDVQEDDIIDLANTEEIPAELRVPKKDNRIKLSAFQCVICMDDSTGLTVTHCGHLFCHGCLHSSLNTDAVKNKCPMCRQKIETRPRGSYNTKTKGFWPLELKLMTGKRLGKQVSK